MLWGILLRLAIVLFFLVVRGQEADAFVYLRTTEVTSPTMVIHVAKKKQSVAKKPAGKKVAQKSSKKKKKKKSRKAKRESAVVANYEYAKASPELCLARNMIGEDEFGPDDSKRSIAYVTIRYALKVNRSVCAEVYSGRYSWNTRKKKRHRRYVHSIKGDQLKPFLRIASEMLANPVPPYKEIAEADGYVHVDPTLSTEKGWGWVQRNTDSLCVIIGAHEYRIEKPHAEYVTIVVGKDEKGRDKKAKIALPMPRSKPVPQCRVMIALRAQPQTYRRDL